MSRERLLPLHPQPSQPQPDLLAGSALTYRGTILTNLRGRRPWLRPGARLITDQLAASTAPSTSHSRVQPRVARSAGRRRHLAAREPLSSQHQSKRMPRLPLAAGTNFRPKARTAWIAGSAMTGLGAISYGTVGLQPGSQKATHRGIWRQGQRVPDGVVVVRTRPDPNANEGQEGSTRSSGSVVVFS